MSSQDRPVSSFKKERKKKTQGSYTETALSESSFKHEMRSSWPYTVAVAIITLIAFWVRMLPSANVFLPNGVIKFISNDAWYHMRTLHTLLANYPDRLFYNPMTNYPYGSFIHFGPLFDQMMAITALVLGFGNPNPHLVNTIGAYFPAVLGALTVIPVYYIGKYLGGHKTGILAAIFIAFAPGQFLFRSLVGVVDHHVAEALFSTFFMMFFILALITAKRKGLRFEHVLNKEKDISVFKEPLIYSVVAGIMYSAYQLTWPGASLFLLIVLAYAVVQYIVDNFNNESSDYLGFTGIITFLVSAILILPFVHADMGFSLYYYSWFHVMTAIGAMAGFAVLSFLEREFKTRGIKAYYFPLLILGIGIFGLMLAKVASPSVYSLIINTPHTVFGIQTGGPSTIQEVSSMFEVGGQFTLRKVFDNFTTPAFLISTLGLLILIPKVFQQKSKPQELVVLIWSVFMLLAIYGQNRFGYYYSINVSILSAYVGGLFLEMVKWNRLEENFRKDVKSLGDAPKFLKSIRIEHILAVLIIVVVLVVPQYNKAMTYANVRADPDEPWTEATTWLSTNTPDPGMDFNGIYDAPANGQPFDYPDNAYGVMSWWDYGHYIETIGNRMPNANPFQAGIGGRSQSIEEENRPGAATFLTAQSEEEASAVLEAIDPDPEKSGARYIISDNKMAIDIFSSITQWTLDTEGYYQSYWTGSGYQTVPSIRYFNSMEARLHLFDANGLKQYRLVHETWPYQTAETGYKQVYNLLFGGNVPAVDTGYVKIFEYVKGAKITGVANPNDAVNLRITILTGQQRSFEYSQSTVADSQGNYAFTVPYSTEGPISGQTQFDVAPTGPYTISYGTTTKEVRVNEDAVLKGQEIKA